MVSNKKKSTIAIFSLLLIYHSYAQTGDRCWLKTCSVPGQVRIDAVFDAAGNFMGGCNCACDPGLYDPNSRLYCEEPKTINYNEQTLQGDCSCQCPSGFTPTACPFPRVYDPEQCGCGCPSFAPDPSTCRSPQEFNPITCQCSCEIGSIGGPCVANGEAIRDSTVLSDCTCDTALVNCPGNQVADPITGACGCPDRAPNGAFFPTCYAPLSRDPLTCDCVATTTTLPPVGPAEISCSSAGSCACPYGTLGPCTINCETGRDACKDGQIECNNAGYDCIVNCKSPSACAGAANIMGPVGGALTVNCIGSGSCEGAVTIDGESGTDMTVICDGGQSCKGNVHFMYGFGAGKLECNGPFGADTCSGAPHFSLPYNAENTIGVAFSCVGNNCPYSAPIAFNNIPMGQYPTPRPVASNNFGGGNGMPTYNNIYNYNPVPANPVPLPTYNYNPLPTYSYNRLPTYNYNPPPTMNTLPTYRFMPSVYNYRPPTPNPVPAPLPIQQTPQYPGPGQGVLPAPGVGAGGGTVIINTAPPVPLMINAEIVICSGTGVTCTCTGNRACTIKCEDADSCKEAMLECPVNHDCSVVCAEKACQSATVHGPKGKSFKMSCPGMGSCVDMKMFSDEATDVTFTCAGKDACKGASKLNCGTGECFANCGGESACDGAAINVNSATSFKCSGYGGCPNNFTPAPVVQPTEPPTIYVPCGGMPPCPCSHTQCFTQRDPMEQCQCVCPTEILLKEARGDPGICGDIATHQVYDTGSCACDCPASSLPQGGCRFGQSFNQNTCQCECPNGNECPGAAIRNLETCTCECPAHSPTASDCSAVGKVLRNCQCACPIPCKGMGQIQSPNTCACGCPFGTPTAAQCESGIVDELACDCAAPLPSTFCCHTSVPGFKPWQGRCWDEQTEAGCNAEPNGRCTWKPNECMDNPPSNSVLPGVGCVFRDEPCFDNNQCCSEVCKVDGTCR